MKHTHADRLERWIGKDRIEAISAQFRDFYYPVALHGVPGNVRVMPGGDFTGEILAGEYMSAQDGAAAVLKKIQRAAEAKVKREKALSTLIDMIHCDDKNLASVGAFASIDAVIAAYTGGKGQTLMWMKSGKAGASTAGYSTDMWLNTGTPTAGSAASAAPGGTVLSASSTGALGFVNLGSANGGHYLNWAATSSIGTSALMLYDRLFAVAKVMNSTAAEAVTGVPTRYQNTTAGTVDYVGGNFAFPMVPTVQLSGTSHTWATCTYLDQDGAAGTFQSSIGTSWTLPSVMDLASGDWFLRLAAGDVGVKALTQIQCSALVTGDIDFVIGHPIAVNICPVANISCLDEGLHTSLNLTPILDNACLGFIELCRPGNTAAQYSGIVRTVSE